LGELWEWSNGVMELWIRSSVWDCQIKSEGTAERWSHSKKTYAHAKKQC
jgi:hypothetical protein